MASVPLTQEDGPTPGQFTVWRTGSTESALAVGYSVSGTATGGAYYQALSGSVTIPAGQSSQSFDVVPIDDAVFEGKESVVATLQFAGSYRLSLAREAIVTIVEDDPSPPVILGQRSQPRRRHLKRWRRRRPALRPSRQRLPHRRPRRRHSRRRRRNQLLPRRVRHCKLPNSNSG